jgi:hypothetical protein
VAAVPEGQKEPATENSEEGKEEGKKEEEEPRP